MLPSTRPAYGMRSTCERQTSLPTSAITVAAPVPLSLAALRTRSAGEWKQLFDQRWGSGVWGKHEWIAPQLSAEHIVTFGQGATALQPVPRLAKELGLSDVRIKQCGTSHTGSFKDLGM